MSEEALKLRARGEYNRKDYENAEKSLRKLRNITTDKTWANDVLARLYMNTGRHENAIPLLKDNLEKSTNKDRELHFLIKCYRVTTQYEKGLELIAESEILANNDEVTWDETWALIEDFDDVEAIEKFLNKIEKYSNREIHFDLMRLRLSLLKKDDKEVSRITLGILETGGIKDIKQDKALKLVNYLTKISNHNQALSILDNLENVGQVRRLKIENLRKIGEYEKALEVLSEMRDGNQITDGERFEGIRLAWDIGDMNLVKSFSDEVLEQNPFSKVASTFYIRSLIKIGTIEELRTSSERILVNLPNHTEAIFLQITLAYEEDLDYQKAVNLCDRILEFEPNNRRAITTRINALRKLNLIDEMLNSTYYAREILPLNDEVLLTAAQAELHVNSGKQIDVINQMLNNHGLAEIYTTDDSKTFKIESLNCNIEAISEHEELVSVVMTVFGRDKYLDVAVNSILNQTHKNLELIIVDDCSKDDAWEYLQTLPEKDSRIHVLQVEKNGGTYIAKNYGLTKAKGEFITFMDSDDWTHPERIERQISVLKSNNNIRAVWHNCFRIDENGSIRFRGNGAIRKSCISLMCKSKTFSDIGFFDSLRVGADTEFIERIGAFYGEDSIVLDPLPTMFMLQHTSSLTGGGSFHISWRSIIGFRLQHHSEFRQWHRKIKHGNNSPFVSDKLRVRPFIAPEEMLAGDIQWRPGSNLFGEEIKKRHHRWWTEKKPMWQKHLSEKIKGEEFVLERGISVVPKFFTTDSYEDQRFQDLPNSYVIKTSVGYSANQVFPVKNGKNVFTDEAVSVNEILDKLQNDSFVQNQNHKIIVEELVDDEFGHKIPLDYKFFMFGEKIAAIQVIDRPSKKKHEQSQGFYDENWNKIPIDIWPLREEVDKFKKSKFFDEMKTSAKTLGKELGIFMRIDFYTTKDGFYFGEFTPTPDGGKGYSEEGNRFLGTFWKGEEGVLGS